MEMLYQEQKSRFFKAQEDYQLISLEYTSMRKEYITNKQEFNRVVA